MKAVRLHAFHQQPVVDEVPEPKIAGPLDVIVKVGGAGVCRTDLHIIEGQWDAAMGTPLPYILGHENAGWVHEIGSAVTSVAVGDTVILHPTPTCGLCRACRAGQDMHCSNSTFPGLSIPAVRPRVRRSRGCRCWMLRTPLRETRRGSRTASAAGLLQPLRHSRTACWLRPRPMRRD
jgi:D-arabinose 1-dehydrogenase-like Zn-dependent alcohol dehydrogenase